MGLSASGSQAVQKEQVKPMMNGKQAVNDNDEDDKGFMKLRYKKKGKPAKKSPPPKAAVPMRGGMPGGGMDNY